MWREQGREDCGDRDDRKPRTGKDEARAGAGTACDRGRFSHDAGAD